MDNRTFIANVAKTFGADTKTTARLAALLADTIADTVADGDSIAIPGFGNFNSVQIDEKIATDPETGRRQLLPPSVKVSFEPATRLKKALRNNE